MGHLSYGDKDAVMAIYRFSALRLSVCAALIAAVGGIMGMKKRPKAALIGALKERRLNPVEAMRLAGAMFVAAALVGCGGGSGGGGDPGPVSAPLSDSSTGDGSTGNGGGGTAS